MSVGWSYLYHTDWGEVPSNLLCLKQWLLCIARSAYICKMWIKIELPLSKWYTGTFYENLILCQRTLISNLTKINAQIPLQGNKMATEFIGYSGVSSGIWTTKTWWAAWKPEDFLVELLARKPKLSSKDYFRNVSFILVDNVEMK